MKPIINKISTYLYQFLCDDYDEERAADYFLHLHEEGLPVAPACSAIRNGNYFGRNFDFVYSKLIDFIMQIPSACDRYASIGVGCTVGQCTTDNIDCGISEEVCNLIPFCVWDGINENGVAFCTNVVPCIDLNHQTTGTNPGQKPLLTPFIGREILDHAASAKDAIRLLNERNIITPEVSVLRMTHDLHFMIADQCDTFVVEFVDNRLVCRKDERIMTNFYLSLPLQPHSCGLERYDLAKKHYGYAGEGMEQMSEVLELLHYRRAYDLCTKPFWYSEHLAAGLQLGIDITVFNMMQYADLIHDYVRQISFDSRDGYLNPWHSMHSSVYDICNRKLRLFVQENYCRCYEFDFDPARYVVRHRNAEIIHC